VCLCYAADADAAQGGEEACSSCGGETPEWEQEDGEEETEVGDWEEVVVDY
jgi:hypothetical protein